MHVTAVSNAIKKRGQLDDYEKAAWKYGKAKEAVESARAGLLLRPRKARRWLQQRQHSVCPKPRIPFFWFTSIGVQK